MTKARAAHSIMKLGDKTDIEAGTITSGRRRQHGGGKTITLQPPNLRWPRRAGRRRVVLLAA